MLGMEQNVATGSNDQIEDFMAESGIAKAITLDTVAVGLRRRLTAEGAVCHIRRDGGLQLRALLARRWGCSSSERIESWLVSAIWAAYPYARVNSIRLWKRGRYVEAEIGVT